MEQNKRKQLEAAAEQGNRFASLKKHPEWETFVNWMNTAVVHYQRDYRNPKLRDNHIALASALEGERAIMDILTKFEQSITAGIEARTKLQEDDLGRVTTSRTRVNTPTRR